MVKFYATQIKRGKLTIEQVPSKWYTDVYAEILRDKEG